MLPSAALLQTRRRTIRARAYPLSGSSELPVHLSAFAPRCPRGARQASSPTPGASVLRNEYRTAAAVSTVALRRGVRKLIRTLVRLSRHSIHDILHAIGASGEPSPGLRSRDRG